MRQRPVTKAEMAEMLAGVPLFSSCSKRERSLLAGIAEEHEVQRGETICRAGDATAALHVIVDGQAEVSVDGDRRRQLRQGDFFGEIALIHRRPRTATVTALTPVRLLTIPGWSFTALLKRQPGLAVKMLHEVTRRLADLDASVQK